MMKLDVVSNKDQHFVLRVDEAARVEISVVDGKVMAHVYRGSEDDLEQEPAFVFDGGENNVSVVA